MKRKDLHNFLDQLLIPQNWDDYGPNGLQIEGQSEIKKIAFAVSATARSAEGAVTAGCDTLIVHHGLFWKFHGVRTLTGPFAQRVFPLVRNHINLFAYHLPLDAHLEVGNAAALAKKLEIRSFTSLCDSKGVALGVQGAFSRPLKASELKDKLTGILDHEVLMSSPDHQKPVSTIGIITGGANKEWVLAKKNQLDAYLTGEMSEHDWHESQESGIHMFAGGHNATESFGIQALMEKIQTHFSVECHFFPSDNPA